MRRPAFSMHASKCDAMRYTLMWCVAVQGDALWRSGARCHAMNRDAVAQRGNTRQCGTAQRNAAHCDVGVAGCVTVMCVVCVVWLHYHSRRCVSCALLRAALAIRRLACAHRMCHDSSKARLRVLCPACAARASPRALVVSYHAGCLASELRSPRRAVRARHVGRHACYPPWSCPGLPACIAPGAPVARLRSVPLRVHSCSLCRRFSA